MSKQSHELIAVIGDLSTKVKAILAETIKTFKDKPTLFLGTQRRVEAFNDNDAQALNSTEQTEITTTVPERLRYTFDAVKDEVNARASLDATNNLASADLIIDGVVIAPHVPAVTLLLIEQQAGAWLELYTSAPTLTNGIAWEEDLDKNASGEVHVTVHPVIKKKTRPVTGVVELSPATKEHKAQVKEVVTDTPVANIIETTWSGMLSSADKAAGADRVQKLKMAAKEARQRANSTPIIVSRLGDQIVEFLENGLKNAAIT